MARAARYGVGCVSGWPSWRLVGCGVRQQAESAWCIGDESELTLLEFMHAFLLGQVSVVVGGTHEKAAAEALLHCRKAVVWR